MLQIDVQIEATRPLSPVSSPASKSSAPINFSRVSVVPIPASTFSTGRFTNFTVKSFLRGVGLIQETGIFASGGLEASEEGGSLFDYNCTLSWQSSFKWFLWQNTIWLMNSRV